MLEDSAILESPGRQAFTCDSYTVSPFRFPGGDIGKLAIAGTVNDLAMVGARARYLSCAFMIEEGFLEHELEEIVSSMVNEMKVTGASIVTGDTKVVPRGAVDGLFISMSGIGSIQFEVEGARLLQEHDAIITSGTIGDHGACILAARNEFRLQSELHSDCRSLCPLVEAIGGQNVKFRAMRDLTRGGLSATLNEWSISSQKNIEIDESSLPLKREVRGISELLGIEPWQMANEGCFVLAVEPRFAEKAISALHSGGCTDATRVGTVSAPADIPRVYLITMSGSSRILENGAGELLPRIC